MYMYIQMQLHVHVHVHATCYMHVTHAFIMIVDKKNICYESGLERRPDAQIIKVK